MVGYIVLVTKYRLHHTSESVRRFKVINSNTLKLHEINTTHAAWPDCPRNRYNKYEHDQRASKKVRVE